MSPVPVQLTTTAMFCTLLFINLSQIFSVVYIYEVFTLVFTINLCDVPVLWNLHV